MSIKFKKGEFRIRENENEEYRMPFNVVSEESSQEQIQKIEQKGNQVLESIPEDYSDLTEEVDNIKKDVENLPLQVIFGEPTVLVDTTEVTFTYDEVDNVYISENNPLSGLTDFEYNTLYKVTWDDAEYEVFKITKGISYSNYRDPITKGAYDYVEVGDSSILGRSSVYDTSIPFLITKNLKSDNNIVIFTKSDSSTHRIKIVAVPFTRKYLPKAYYDYISNGTPLLYKGQGDHSIVGQLSSIATGKCSIALGSGNVVAGKYSVAFGFDNIIRGDNSIASGSGGTVNGNNSILSSVTVTSTIDGSPGKTYPIIDGHYSIAVGAGVVTLKNSSVALGQGCKTESAYGQAMGDRTWSKGAGEHVIGKCNITSPPYSGSREGLPSTASQNLFVIGNGIGITEELRSNAMTVDWDGNGWFSGHVECDGLVMTSPNGTKYMITVNDDGTLVTAPYIE